MTCHKRLRCYLVEVSVFVCVCVGMSALNLNRLIEKSLLAIKD